MTTPYDVIVVGAGHNGLVTAAYLGRAGWRTLVLERRDIVGGAAVTESVFSGFRVDTGAHWFSALHPAVIKDLDLARQGLSVVRPDPMVFAPTPDGRHLQLWRDPLQSAKAIRSHSARDAERWPAFCKQMSMLAGFLARIHHSRPVSVPAAERADLWQLLRLGTGLRRLGEQDMIDVLRTLPMSVAELLDEWFETEVLKGTVGATGLAGLFQGPMSAGTSYVMVHQQVGNALHGPRGVQFARGGIGTITDALASAAREAGVEIRTGRPVEHIMVSDGAATGVVLETGEEIPARAVVSNADPRRTFLDLVGPTHLDPDFMRAVTHLKFRGACAKVHLTLDALPDFTALPGDGRHLDGVISISPSLEYLERAYDDAKFGECSRNPYLEIVIPSRTDPSMAPSGKHVMSIVVQFAPYRLSRGEWTDDGRRQLADSVIETLAAYAPNVKDAIRDRHVMSPVDLETTFGLPEGNIHHGELTLDQLYFMRPVPGWADYRTPIHSLYLCGAGTHPGGGVTGTPGFNAAREILRRQKR